jgi:hypothetical protein
MPKHDEDMGGIGKNFFGGQLGLVLIYSMQRPNKTHDNSLSTKLTFLEASAPVSGL